MRAATTRTYLDHNATSPLRPEAREAVLAAMDAGGNPSSVHAEGQGGRGTSSRAPAPRSPASAASRARSVTFVSGGAEAANTALNPRFGVGPKEAPLDRLIVGAGEHPCVLHGNRFPASAVEVAPLRPDGRIDLDWVRGRLPQAGSPAAGAAGGEQ